MRLVTYGLGLWGVLAIAGCSDGGGREFPFEALTCAEPGTTLSLMEKAERYDRLAQEQHIPEGQEWLFSVTLQDDLATLDYVALSDNVGTWTGLYTASQAFRAAATGSPEAVDNLRRALRAERDMMAVTGVRGLFARALIKPDLPGFPSAAQLEALYPNCDLSVAHCKRYNLATEGEYAGWYFKNDVSKDEYASHMFAVAVAWELVDDPEVRALAGEIASAVGDHLIDHSMLIRDIDGEVTTYGSLRPLSMDDFPGFNALLGLSWMRVAAAVSGEKYADFYQNCLLQRSGQNACLHDPEEEPLDYTQYLDNVGLDLGCMTNWNNHNMAQLAAYALLRLEDDPSLLPAYRRALRDELWDAEADRPMRKQQKSLYTFFYLVNKDPADPWPEAEASQAMCVMKKFPESKEHWAVDTASRYPEACLDRSNEPITDVVIPIWERGSDNFVWINNPYKLEQEDANPRIVESPEDYLLAYWMGRYFGFIREDM